MNSPSREELFESQKRNTLYSLSRYGLSLAEIKEQLQMLGYYAGEIDDEFTKEFAHCVKRFQSLNNMRHVDGMIGELSLRKIEEEVSHKSKKQ